MILTHNADSNVSCCKLIYEICSLSPTMHQEQLKVNSNSVETHICKRQRHKTQKVLSVSGDECVRRGQSNTPLKKSPDLIFGLFCSNT